MTVQSEAVPSPLVEMRDISVAFGGVRAVRGVSIDLHAGEVVGIAGGVGAAQVGQGHPLGRRHPWLGAPRGGLPRGIEPQ